MVVVGRMSNAEEWTELSEEIVFYVVCHIFEVLGYSSPRTPPTCSH